MGEISREIARTFSTEVISDNIEEIIKTTKNIRRITKRMDGGVPGAIADEFCKRIAGVQAKK